MFTFDMRDGHEDHEERRVRALLLALNRRQVAMLQIISDLGASVATLNDKINAVQGDIATLQSGSHLSTDDEQELATIKSKIDDAAAALAGIDANLNPPTSADEPTGVVVDAADNLVASPTE